MGVLRVRRERELVVRVEGAAEGRGAGPGGGVGGGERTVLRAGVGEGGRGGEVGVAVEAPREDGGELEQVGAEAGLWG